MNQDANNQYKTADAKDAEGSKTAYNLPVCTTPQQRRRFRNNASGVSLERRTRGPRYKRAVANCQCRRRTPHYRSGGSVGPDANDKPRTISRERQPTGALCTTQPHRSLGRTVRHWSGGLGGSNGTEP